MPHLAKLIAHYRLLERKTVRELAFEIGVSPSTISRVERGEMMDGATLAALIAWILEIKETPCKRFEAVAEV